MHIIIDGTTTQDQLAYAGPGQYAKNIILHLVKLFPDTKYSILLFNNKESTLGKIQKYENVEIIDIGKYRINDYKNDIWYFFNILPLINKVKKKNSIFFSPYFWRNFPSYSMKTVLFVHDMNLPLFNMYSQISPLHNFVRMIQYWAAMYKSLKCKKIVFNSETSRNDYLHYFPQYPVEDTTVSYLGVDLEVEESSLDNILPSDYRKRSYIIYLGGGINRSKNSIGVIKGYISFLKKLNSRTPPYLVIAGGKFEDRSKKEVKELYDLIQKENISKHVIFTGFYEDHQKYSLLKNSFAFIHLSLYEGFGISPIEALRAKIPVILHKNPVYEELFNEVAIMVNGLDAKEVGDTIYDVFKNSEKYSDRVDDGYKLSKRHTWENVARSTHEVFKEIV